ncbi:MAG: histidine phosphatase family protein [Emcibacter sp.]|nr:histidine phosphatase family protein [Emcibacter sp.]
MAEIYLVRHGQASFHSDNYDKLSDLGRLQSEYLGHYFAERNIVFNNVITGTQMRHHQTAEGITTAFRQKPNYIRHVGLNEYDFEALYKAYMNLHPEEGNIPKDGDRRIFYQRLKQALNLWSEDKITETLPESWSDFQNRTKNVLSHLHNTMDGKSLVISSGGTISMIMGHILGLSAQKIIDLNLQIKNTSFSHIYLGRHNIHLSSFNNIPHLDHQDRLDIITFS